MKKMNRSELVAYARQHQVNVDVPHLTIDEINEALRTSGNAPERMVRISARCSVQLSVFATVNTGMTPDHYEAYRRRELRGTLDAF